MNRRIVAVLLGFFIFLMYFNTLLPFSFDYGWGDLAEQFDRVWLIPQLNSLSLTDLVGNVLLFVPFGFLMFVRMRQQLRPAAFLITVSMGFLISLSIEFTQLFIQSRDSATHDLLTNTIGTAIGATVAAIYAGLLQRHVQRAFLSLLREQPYALIPVIVALSQALAAVMPFTVSITVSSLKKSLKSTNLIPFDYQSIGKLFLGYPGGQDALPFDITPMIENLLYWAAVGYVLFLCYRLYWAEGKWGRVFLWGLPLLYFPLLEFAQLFIVNRTSDINDIISGYAGLGLGYLIAGRLLPQQLRASLQLLRPAVAIYLLYILFSGLRPFDWTLDHNIIERDMRPGNLIPFYAYFRKTSLWNIYDLIDSLTFFLPVSFYWSCLKRQEGGLWIPLFISMAVAGLLVGLLLEVSQLLSVSRIAEITDVLAYGGGGALGVFLLYYYEKQLADKY